MTTVSLRHEHPNQDRLCYDSNWVTVDLVWYGINLFVNTRIMDNNHTEILI